MFFFFFDEEKEDKFSTRLSSAMKDQAIDEYALSEIISVSPTTVKRWLDGKFAPRNINLPRIADALGVSSDYLLSRT